MHVHVNRVLRLCVCGRMGVYGCMVVRVCVYMGRGSGWIGGLYKWVGVRSEVELMGLYECGM